MKPSSMTHRLTTIYAKNYCNWTLIVEVIIENVVTCFLGHSVDAPGCHFGIVWNWAMNTCEDIYHMFWSCTYVDLLVCLANQMLKSGTLFRELWTLSGELSSDVEDSVLIQLKYIILLLFFLGRNNTRWSLLIVITVACGEVVRVGFIWLKILDLWRCFKLYFVLIFT